MDKILKQVLKDIKPSKEDELLVMNRINEVVKKIQKSVKEAKVILGGSGKKGTWLNNPHDADIFIQYPASYSKKDISSLLETKLKKLFKIKRLHGSRDYFQTKINNFIYEMVPIIEITKADNAYNITDISPLHAKYVLKNKKYQDQIRLTKQFFKSAKVYGAESYINGFSGYICEILTIHYKGFKNLLKNIAKWKPKTIIDTKKYHKNPIMDIDKSKTHGPLIIVDPVQASRNAAAAVSLDKYNQLINYTKSFLNKPKEDFFIIKPININKLKKKKGNFFMFKITPKTGKEDVVGCKILKAYEHIIRELNNNDFTLLYSDWEWDKLAYFYFIIKENKLPNKKIIKGPPKSIKKHAEIFKKLHKDTFIKNNILYANEKRKYTNPNKLMKEFIKDKYIKEHVKKIEVKA